MMAMTLFLTALVGAAVACAVAAVAPRPVGLARRVGRATGELDVPETAAERLRVRLQQGVGPSLLQDLEITGTTTEAFVVRRLQWMAGLGALALVLGPLAVAAVGFPVVLLPLFVVVATAGGWPLAGRELTQRAADRRREARLSVSEWLQLTANMMLAGTSLEQAMAAAARAGTGWTFDAMQEAFARAIDRGHSFPEALDELGTSIALTTLREIATEIRLTLDRGAPVAEAIAARARRLRQDELHTQLAEAESASERVAVPLVGLALTFLAFVAWPAVAVLLDL